jgi:hypothetical protein
MTKIVNASGLAAILFGLLAYAGPAEAQALRTFVSGAGDDGAGGSFNCTHPDVPCGTLPFAYSKTAVGGEIDILDGGDFNPSALTLAITHSITIANDGAGTAGLSPTSNNGDATISINSGTSEVVLRGLDIRGAIGGGVSFASGGVLVIDHCTIHDGQGPGITFAPINAATLVVKDTVIRRTGTASVPGVWIYSKSGGGGGAVKAHFERVQILKAIGSGIRVDTTQGGQSPVDVELRDVTVDGAGAGAAIAAVSPTSGGPSATIMADNVTSLHNAGYGLRAVGGTASIVLRRSMIESNAVGIGVSSGGRIFSYGDNSFANNTSDGVAPTPIGLK